MTDPSSVDGIATHDLIPQGSETRVHAARPPTLSAPTTRALARHIGRAFGTRGGAGSPLREVVLRTVAELLAAGATQEMIDDVLTRAVRDHPDRYRNDHVSIITRVSASDALMVRVLAWARAPSSVGTSPANVRR
jgi:hypothetical protein